MMDKIKKLSFSTEGQFQDVKAQAQAMEESILSETSDIKNLVLEMSLGFERHLASLAA